MIVVEHRSLSASLLFAVAYLVLAFGLTWLGERGTSYRLRDTTLNVRGAQNATVSLTEATPVRVVVQQANLHLYIGTVRIRLGSRRRGMPSRFESESLRALADALGRSDHDDARQTAEWLRHFALQPTYDVWPSDRNASDGH